MHASDLRPVPGSTHKKKRVGRGNASQGTTAGRGTKGQQSRTGVSIPAWFEGGQLPLVRGLSRLRGFKNARFRVEYEPINVEMLNRFDAGSTVNVELLRKSGLVKSGKMPVKILGEGEITVALTVEADRFSESARGKIEAAGGTVVELTARREKTAARTRFGTTLGNDEPAGNDAEESEETEA